jgi:multidrug efflux pump subunit AcrA (membrane-fusion protein)
MPSPQDRRKRLLGWGVAIAASTLAACGTVRSAPPSPAPSPDGQAAARRADIEDVFLLSGELEAVHSTSIVTPRSEGELQIRWMAEDGATVAEGDKVVEFDPSRLIQGLEERRLKVRQAEIDLEGKERTAAAEAERKRVAVEKAEVERDKARIDAHVPRDLQPAVDWQKKQNSFHEIEAAFEKARLEEEAYRVTGRADVAVARVAVEKARRELTSSERLLASMSTLAPKSGVFLVGNFWQWGPEGPRKLQPGDTVWPGYPVATIPDPSDMQVAATLTEVDHGRIAPGMKARCILDTHPDRIFQGRVEDVGAVAAEESGGFRPPGARAGFSVRVSLDRADPLMRPGLSVRVEVVRRRWPRALVVPRRAARDEGARLVVERSSGSGNRTVPVEACTPLDCVVPSGLEEGDRVLLF